MNTLFKCGICGKEYADLTSYVNCVTSCATAENKKAERNKEMKSLKACVDDAINTFNKSKEYLDYRLNEFKNKYPEEYAKFYSAMKPLNTEGCCGGNDCCECEVEDCSGREEKHENITNNFYVKFDTSNGKPKIEAVINGKPAADPDEALKILMDNPEFANLARILGDL